MKEVEKEIPFNDGAVVMSHCKERYRLGWEEFVVT